MNERAEKLDFSQLWVWKRAVRFLPHEIISFQGKKNKLRQKYRFIRRDRYKLGQTPLDQQNISKVWKVFLWKILQSGKFLLFFWLGSAMQPDWLHSFRTLVFFSNIFLLKYHWRAHCIGVLLIWYWIGCCFFINDIAGKSWILSSVFLSPLSINDIEIKLDGKRDQLMDDIAGSDIFYIRLKINSFTAVDLVAGRLSLMQLQLHHWLHLMHWLH